jgi:hypothetical protein
MPNILRIKIKIMRWARDVACIREKRDFCRPLVGKPEEKYVTEKT